MPTIAIRTINFEKVRFDLNVIRLATNQVKLNAACFFVPSQICGFTANLDCLQSIFYEGDKSCFTICAGNIFIV
jgi:hypothetical protein